jgi:alpha,alpha-trehalase
MAWDIYKKTQNRKWLKEEVLPAIEKQYNYFLKASHYVKNINLFRYYSYSCRPAYEVLHSKCPTEKLYFEKVKFYFEEFYNKKFKTYYDKEQEKLTSKFFRADRSVRESGFDISGQFGMFSYAINEFNPTSLNSLLYINLNVLSMGYAALGEDEKAEKWMKVRDELGKSINKHLWNEKEETYYSYNFRRKKISDYLYASTFYPWWAKIPEQKNKDKLLKPLSLLEQNGGIICSLKDTDKQWDFPFGWAPLQYIAFKALLNYGYEEHARRLALKWINTVNNYFEKFGSVFEKYNMIENEHPNIEYGYASNEIGFGWTNGVYMYFYKYLTKDK